MEGFFWNLPEFGRRYQFDVLHGSEKRPLGAHFQSREQQMSLGARRGDSGGWMITGMPLWARNCCKTRDVWLGALSCCFLHHDNAPSHTALVLQQFLANKSVPVITLPSYSPDLALSDILHFPNLKMGPKGTRFAIIEIECDGRTPEDSKRSIPPVFPTMAGSMEQVRVRARVHLWR